MDYYNQKSIYIKRLQKSYCLPFTIYFLENEIKISCINI